MNQERYILTDIDGVVLDWERGFHEWMRSNRYVLEDNEVYGVHNMYAVERDVARKFVQTFNESAACGFLKPMKKAEIYMPKIAKEFGYKFIAVTSFGTEEYSQRLRTQLLRDVVGDIWEDIYMIGMGDDKDDILADLRKSYEGAIWIEDKPENAETGARLGYDSLLMEHPHSEDYEFKFDYPVYKVKDWEQIYLYVKTNEMEYVPTSKTAFQLALADTEKKMTVAAGAAGRYDQPKNSN